MKDRNYDKNIPYRPEIFPVGNRVLVLPDQIEETTKGGIIIAPNIAEQHMHSQSIGVLVAVGPDAWQQYVTTKYRHIDGGWKPVEQEVTGYSMPFATVGDRVSFAKFQGQVYLGEDGQEYRLLNDTDITARVGEKINFSDLHARKGVGVK